MMQRIIPGLLFGCFMLAAIAHAERPNASGEITLGEDHVQDENNTISGRIDVDLVVKKKKQRDPYEVAQDSTIDYFKGLVKKTEGLAKGETSQITPLATNELLHLNGLYLYCSIHNGTCPDVLDAIMEADVINSKLSGKVDCPILKSFWKSWITNKLEKRHRHHVKTGFMHQTTAFKKNILPRYLRCTDTVEKELADGNGKSNADFFAARYSERSLKKDPLVQIVNKLEVMKQNIPNVFIETE